MTEKYRKKPVEVEVIKFDRSKWSGEESQEKASETFPMVAASIGSGFKTVPVIETLEGDMKVSDGDYIIKGVQGEFYPCKPDIFHETYEPVTDHQPTFEVGEYYADEYGVYKILEDGECMAYSFVGGEFDRCLQWYTLNDTVLATAEQIAEFKRAEHFADHGRELDEFKTDDICIFRGKVVLIQELDSAGDLWFYGNQFGEEYLSKEELKHLSLIQTAEELREVGNNE